MKENTDRKCPKWKGHEYTSVLYGRQEGASVRIARGCLYNVSQLDIICIYHRKKAHFNHHSAQEPKTHKHISCVPVLSEQITDVQPRVSTDGSERTMAFFFAIRREPSARHVVITAGRPSGIAATARATKGEHLQGEQE